MLGTTIEQGEKLIKAGISSMTADLNWKPITDEEGKIEYKLDDTPALLTAWPSKPSWSAEALLDLLPKKIYLGRIYPTPCYLRIIKDEDTGEYWFSYVGITSGDDYISAREKGFIDACAEFILELKKEHYSEEGEDDDDY